jgi:hypothetical protein
MGSQSTDEFQWMFDGTLKLPFVGMDIVKKNVV